MFGIGTSELVVIIIVAVMVLGPEHLPRVMRTITKLTSDFRRINTEFQRAINLEANQEEYRQKHGGQEQVSTAKPKKKKKKKKPPVEETSQDTAESGAVKAKSSPLQQEPLEQKDTPATGEEPTATQNSGHTENPKEVAKSTEAEQQSPSDEPPSPGVNLSLHEQAELASTGDLPVQGGRA